MSSAEPTGGNIASIRSPVGVAQNRINGFSKNTDMLKKNASVIMVTTITQGKNSRSLFQLRSITAEEKADISQLQKSRDPD
jgi:hypothetical protein